MPTTPRVKLLVGAPLTFVPNDDLLTVTHFLPVFQRFLYRSTNLSEPVETNQTQTPSDRPAWRVLSQSVSHLPTGFSQRAWLDNDAQKSSFCNCEEATPREIEDEGDTSCLATTSFSTAEEDVDEDEFLERSIALHDDISTPPQLTTTSLALSVSFSESDASPAVLKTSLPPRQIPTAPHLTHLSHLPSAAHLHRVAPQTVTTDLVVAIIATSPARRVTIRRTGNPIDLVELLVGDDSAAGFTVAFWVRPGVDDSQDVVADGTGRGATRDDGMHKELEALRRGDVVLLRNVALTPFRGKVQGQSLGRRWHGGGARGGETTVRVLWRRGGGNDMVFDDGHLDVHVDDAEERTGAEREERDGTMVRKTRAVRDWAWRFIGAPITSAGEGTAAGTKRSVADSLPPSKKRRFAVLPPDDTQ